MYAEIEGDKYIINNGADLIAFVKAILDKREYSGERICLEAVQIEDGKNLYTEIGRWPL